MGTKQKQRHQPGEIRDAIVAFLKRKAAPATIHEIIAGIKTEVGEAPSSSVRSYLNLNTPGRFQKIARGTYILTGEE